MAKKKQSSMVRGRRQRRSSTLKLSKPSADHLRNAAVEVLEAFRAMLDESVARIREGESPKELTRIAVRK
jgi:hypothetical protein